MKRSGGNTGKMNINIDNSIETLCHIFERENTTIIINPSRKDEIILRKLGTFTKTDIDKLTKNGFYIHYIEPINEHHINIALKRVGAE